MRRLHALWRGWALRGRKRHSSFQRIPRRTRQFESLELRQLLSVFSDLVMAANPAAYWRLGEVAGSAAAANLGSIGGAVNGVYQGAPGLTAAGLPADEFDTSVYFDGVDDRVDLPNHASINTGGPYATRTVSLWFKADGVSNRQMLYEEGGDWRGLNIYLDAGRIYVGAWNTVSDDGGATTPWGPFFLNTAVTASVTHQVALVFDQPSGTFSGYLDGVLFASATGVGMLFSHTEANALGGQRQDSYFHDGPSFGDGRHFQGVIDEVAFYSAALSGTQLAAQWQAGQPQPPPPQIVAADIDVKPGSEVNPINFGSQGKLPVAILTTSTAAGEAADFDATTVDVTTVRLGDARDGFGTAAPVLSAIEDVDGDGDLDLILQFAIRDLRNANALSLDTKELTLAGETVGGTEFAGSDHVRVVPPCRIGVFRRGVWFLDGDGTGQRAERTVAFGMDGDVGLMGDFNGDGAQDLAVYRSGVWFFDFDGDGGRADKVLGFGVWGDLPVVGDWNGDGTTDVAVFRNGTWFFDLDGLGQRAEKKFAFGIPGDTPTAGDFNGDGKWDAAIFRDGRWFFDLDGTGGRAEHSLLYGMRGDQAVVGDWNEDGKSDLGIVRNGKWFLDLDGQGGRAELTLQFGNASDLALAGHFQFDGALDTIPEAMVALLAAESL